MNLYAAIEYIKGYTRSARIMEVCGTHTSVIHKFGVRSLLPPCVRLVSGPGCPVCVAPESFINKLIELSHLPNHTVMCFGDMMRVPGASGSLSCAASNGGSVRLMYSPFETAILAKKSPETLFVIAAIGFETTAPVYAALIQTLIDEGISNVRLLCAVKTMPEILEFVCENESVDGFICPGHVSAITGKGMYADLQKKHEKPFVIAGFTEAHIISAIYEILRQIETCEYSAVNLYKSAVDDDGQRTALDLVDRFFTKTDSYWRGIGLINGSGLKIRSEYARFAIEASDCDAEPERACLCGDVILGRRDPCDCPLFMGECTPDSPVGACMVSCEGACGIWASQRTKRRYIQ